MHVLLTVNAAWNVVNFRMPLIRAFQDDGHRVTVLVPADETVTAIQATGCAVELLRMDKKGLSPKNDLRLMLDMRAAFARLRPDIVFSYTIKNNIYGAFAARGLGIPFVPNITGLGTAFLGSPLVTRIARLLYRRAFAPLPFIIFQNEDDRTFFEEEGLARPEQAVLVPGSGIDLAEFSPSAASTRPGAEAVFLMIARVLADKGAREFAEAARLLKPRYPGVRFQLLGPLDAENRTALSAEEVNSWKEADLVDYLGMTSDVRPAIANADCMVLPSYREGAPRVLIEGAAMGRPMVATDVPGCRSVVQHGVTGYLCEPRSGEALAQAIEQMIQQSPEQRLAMGNAARKDMEARYSVDRVIEIYRDIADRLCERQESTSA